MALSDGVISLGQTTMSDAMPVVIASDQSAVPASQSGTWNITNISGTVSLPTGAATETTLGSVLTELQQKTEPSDTQNIVGVERSATLTLTNTDSTSQTIDCSGMNTVSLHIAGTWNGNVQFHASQDGTNFHQVFGLEDNYLDGELYSSITDDLGLGFPKDLKFECAGWKTFKLLNVSAGTAGTSTLYLRASQAQGILTGIASTVGIQGSVRLLNGVDDSVVTVGQKTMVASLPVVIASNQTAVPVTDNSGSLTVDNSGTFAVQAAQSGTWNVTNVSGTISLPTGAATSALQTQPGVDIGDVTINNAAGAAAVNVQDGGNSITIDATNLDVALSTRLKPADTLTGVTTVGTVSAVTAITNALPAGSNAIGKLAANSGVIIGDVNVVNSNVSTNISQMNGVTVTMGNGSSGTGVQRVTLADDSTGLVKLATGANTIGALTANQSINNAQVNGSTVVTSVTGVQDVMPRKRTSSTGLSPNYTASHITTKTTTTPTAATAYVSAIAIACSAAGTAWTMVIQNKEGTPKILVPSFTLTVPTTGLPVILQFAEPILMTSGIDIITGGTTAGTVDVFVTYWQ